MISVILATHRDDNYIADAVQSVLNQNEVVFELLLIANNCSSSYFEKLKKLTDPRIRLISTKIPQHGFNLNFGIDQAKYELIARMDQDDLMKPDRLKSQYDFFQKNPETGVLGSQVEFISASGEVLGVSNYPVENNQIRSKFIFKSAFCHPSVMFRKEIILKYGAYSGGLLSEDYDLWLRLLENKDVIFRNSEKILLSYRKHSQSAQGNPQSYAEVAGHFLKMFLLHRRLRYFIGLLVAIIKALKRGNRV